MKMLEKVPEDRFDDMDAVYRSALQVRFSLGELGATATLAGLSESVHSSSSEESSRNNIESL